MAQFNLSDSIVINTGLTDNISKNVLLSVLGQLSDGIWENSKTMEHYWPYVDVKMIDGSVCLLISKEYSDHYHGINYFIDYWKMNGNSMKIKKWFANKIKSVLRNEAKDYPNMGIKCNLKCNVPLSYISSYDDYNTKITAADACKVVKSLEK